MALHSPRHSQPISKAFYKGLSEAAGKLFYAYLLQLLFPVLVIAAGALAAGGLSALRGLTGESILKTLDIDEAVMIGAVLAAAIVIIIDVYFYYSGASTLKRTIYAEQNPGLEHLYTPATLIHIGTILAILGLITIPVLIGIILAPIGFLLYTIGIILLGSNLKILGLQYTPPGSQLMIGAILQLISIATIYLIFTSILYLVATILIAKAFRDIRNISRRNAERLVYETLNTPIHKPGDQPTS